MKTVRFLFSAGKQATLLAFLMLLSLAGCEGEFERGLPPQHGNPPSPPTVVDVVNLNGAAIINFQAPAVDDVVAVTATYTINNVERVVRASIFNNHLLVEGFGRAGEHTVFLRTVDASRNESAPVAVTVNPLVPPVITIYESLYVRPTFGGIFVTWENKLRNNIIIHVSIQDEFGEWQVLQSFFSSEQEGRGTVRGLPDDPREFRIQVRDRWDNFSEPFYVTETPFFEQRILPTRFHEINPRLAGVNGGIEGDTGDWSTAMRVQTMWLTPGDDNTQWHSNDVGSSPEDQDWFVSFGLGQTVELSRFRIWQRRGGSNQFTFAHNNLRRFSLYGAMEITAEMRAQGGRYGWTHLVDVVSHRPAGPYTIFQVPLTQEDRDFAAGGEEIEMPPGTPPIRFIRIFLAETWGGGRTYQISDIQFWGKILD
ncbi:MAG: DUF5126 domain-containing protein [Dysgonamonadaceae bacterium]|jgi:hypothetical protein|nr:DUF5126 domain-containing protein [Dysgonamonadaceae bacterium]